eukprot:gene13935-biopygen9604
MGSFQRGSAQCPGSTRGQPGVPGRPGVNPGSRVDPGSSGLPTGCAGPCPDRSEHTGQRRRRGEGHNS